MRSLSLFFLMAVLVAFLWSAFGFALIAIFEPGRFRALRYGEDAELDWDRGKLNAAGPITFLFALGGNCIVSSARGPMGIDAFPECGVILNGLILIFVLVSLLINGRWFWRSQEDYLVMVQIVL